MEVANDNVWHSPQYDVFPGHGKQHREHEKALAAWGATNWGSPQMPLAQWPRIDIMESTVRQGFLFTDKGRVWRNAAYHTTAHRPPQTRTFLVKGRKRMFHAPQSW